MDRSADYIFTRASLIAERRGRHARKLQSQSVGRSLLALLSACAGVFGDFRWRSGQARRG